VLNVAQASIFRALGVGCGCACGYADVERERERGRWDCKSKKFSLYKNTMK
jgi:hypothetical protein